MTRSNLQIAMTLDENLDDIKRARIWSELEDRIALDTSTPRAPAAPAASRRSLLAGGFAFAFAAAAVLAFTLWPRTSKVAIDVASDALTVPADATVSAQLGPHTRASVVGPARLALRRTGDATVVALERGTLLADFAGGSNRTLQIDAPGATIEIVGTLFSVEVSSGSTCTSVAHGRVKVTSTASSSVMFVGGGERYCVGAVVRPAIEPIVPAVREALERHEATITAQAEMPLQAQMSPSPSPSASARDDVDGATPPAGAVDVAPGTASADVDVSPPRPRVKSASPAGSSSSNRPAPPTASSSSHRAASPTASTSSNRTASTSTPTASTSSNRATPPTVTTSPPAAPPESTSTSATPSAAAPPTTPTSAVPAPPNPAPQSKPMSAADLYATADTALAARDAAAADRALATLVTTYPDSPLVEQALFDRARIAHQRKQWPAARQHLARLTGGLLAEPSHWLRCRIEIDARENGAARTCLIEYRSAFTRSPHDLDALALLARLAHATGGCRGAAAAVDELVAKYPRTTLAASWRARCANQPTGAQP
jgi:FecR protein